MKTHSYVTMRDFVFYSVSVILVINCNRIEREREREIERRGEWRESNSVKNTQKRMYMNINRRKTLMI